MKYLARLFDNNREWAATRIAEDSGFFARLEGIQRPDFLWIGCADSRVPANEIVGLDPGELFVHRNVANVVPPGDPNVLSALQFAVDALQVKHIIVCGHYGCGGVRAAMDGHRHGIIDHWLQPIRDIADAHEGELSAMPDSDARMNRLCELSIAAQVEGLSRTPIIQSAWKRGKHLAIHGWAYALDDGLIRDLECGCMEQLGGHSHVCP